MTVPLLGGAGAAPAPHPAYERGPCGFDTRPDLSRYSSWNGRTSIGQVVAPALLVAQASAVSRSGTSMMLNPPNCSFVSANGPSVVSTSPLCICTTVAVLASCSPPPNTHTPAATIS